MDPLSQQAALFVGATVLALLLPLPAAARRALLLLANGAFLYTFHPAAPLVFAATSVLGFGAAKVAARGVGGPRLALCALPLLVPLFLPKLDWLLAPLSGGDDAAGAVGNAVGARAAIFIGASYFTLRALAFVLDARRHGRLHLGFFDFLVYNSFFPTIIAGPIERADHFQRSFDRLGRPRGEDVREGARRIFIGLLKKAVLGGIAWKWAAPFRMFADDPSLASSSGAAWIGLYAWLLYTYFDFAGYSDLAIGTARLMGIRLAENFDNPFLRPSIAEFWRGWHLSLSFWIRDYLFLPMCGKSRSPIRPHLAALGSMTLCGLWHDPSLGWGLWGLFHGAGLSIHQAWTNRLRRNFRLKRRLQKSITFRIVGIVLTFHFVALSWVLTIERFDLGVTAAYFQRLFSF